MNAQSSVKIVKSGIAQAVPLFLCCIMIFLSFPLTAAKKHAKEAVSRSVKLSDREREASCADLPLPAGGVLQPTVFCDDDQKNGSSLTYRVKISREEVTSFYEQGMMQLGWHKIAHKRGVEDVMVFETPNKIAFVSMRPDKVKKGWKRNATLILTLQEVSKEQEAELI